MTVAKLSSNGPMNVASDMSGLHLPIELHWARSLPAPCCYLSPDKYCLLCAVITRSATTRQQHRQAREVWWRTRPDDGVLQLQLTSRLTKQPELLAPFEVRSPLGLATQLRRRPQAERW